MRRLPSNRGLVSILGSASAWLVLLSNVSQATIPEPDNVIYGRIAVGTNLLTGAATNFVIDAQRLDGTKVATYRMGDNRDFAGRYVIALPLESLAPVPLESMLDLLHENTDILNPFASLPGTPLRLIVKEARRQFVGGVLTTNYLVHYTSNVVVGTRGTVQLVNFGNVNSNDDGVPQPWRDRYGLPGGSGDFDGDGDPDSKEYVSGTDPTDPNSKFALRIKSGTLDAHVFFIGVRAEGIGYEGRSRYYTLQSNTNSLAAAAWLDIATHTEILAANQQVNYFLSNTNKLNTFFRVRIRLSGP